MTLWDQVFQILLNINSEIYRSIYIYIYIYIYISIYSEKCCFSIWRQCYSHNKGYRVYNLEIWEASNTVPCECLAEIGEHCLFFVKYFGSIDTEVRYSNVKEDMKKQKAKEKNTYARLFQYYQQWLNSRLLSSTCSQTLCGNAAFQWK